MSTVKVGMVALGQLPVDQAVAKDYFSQEGLPNVKIEYQTYPSGAAAIPAMLAGDIDFVYTNNVSAGLAISEGLDLKLAVGADSVSAGNQQVFVPTGSAVKSVKDLQGKTVSVNGLQGLGTLGVNVGLEAEGVDPASVKFTEVAFPEAVSVMQRGDTAATYIVQPFAQSAIAAGTAVKLFDFNDYEELKNLPIGNFYTTGSYASEHPDVVKSFAAAVNLALADLKADKKRVAELTVTAAKVSPETADTIAASIQYIPNQKPSETQRVFDLMTKYKFIENSININDVAVAE
ncbi:ABC transporter substrate-binding protein [Arthrobacter sp. SLBN-100]|uniref:ABC transporter substrate-binding protein n=1 Tax=Arthrobacter sp. SLBN-100 TaxID=2768450 RepID=UPI00135A99E9|nr:ABC transporter substrate-binding protein [Arthrobacter sp. SLBN-100]